MFANMASHSVEVTETEQPLRIEAYEFVPDKAGPASSGGRAVRRDYRFLEEEGVLQVRSDRRRFRPYGLYGAALASRRGTARPEGENRLLPSKFNITIRRNDVFRHESRAPAASATRWSAISRRSPATCATRWSAARRRAPTTAS